MRTPLARLSASVVIAAAALLGVRGVHAADGPAGPNILLITVDTLRADHLGTYGYDLPTSPHIDGLARAGVRCDAVTASASETAPATASLLTGLYQPRHRVGENRDPLPADVTTLAEHLQSRGYATAAFVGNDLVGARYGFRQGFDSFEPVRPDASRRADANGVASVAAWLRAAPAQPWLVWLHLMDPHGPYAPAPEWEARVTYAPDRFGADPAIPVGRSNFGLGIIPRYQVIPGETHLSTYVRRYDGEIAFTDAAIGQLLAVVDELEQRERTIVVVTADHGESLTEHSEYLQHGWFLYQTTLRVPLVVAWPGTLPAGRVVAHGLAGVDLTPTLLDLAGHPLDGLEGASAAALLTGTAPSADDDRIALAVGARANHPVAARQGRWKLIHTQAEPPPIPASRHMTRPHDAPARWELYDVVTDTGELENRFGTDHPAVPTLTAEMRGFRQALHMSGRRW